MPDLEKTIKFLSQFSTDDHLYWLLEGASFGQIEIAWQRKFGGKAWQLRQLPKQGWHYFTDKDFIAYLASEVELRKRFVKELNDTALNQAAFAHLMLEQAMQTFGTEKVEEACQKSKSFIQDLQQVVKGSTNNESAFGAKSDPRSEDPQHKSKRDLRVIDGIGRN